MGDEDCPEAAVHMARGEEHEERNADEDVGHDERRVDERMVDRLQPPAPLVER